MGSKNSKDQSFTPLTPSTTSTPPTLSNPSLSFLVQNDLSSQQMNISSNEILLLKETPLPINISNEVDKSIT